MAQQERYFQQTGAQTAPLNMDLGATASPNDFGYQGARSMEEAGNAIIGTSNMLDQMQQKRERLWATENAQKAELYWTENFQKMQEDATAKGTAGNGFVPSFKQSYDDYMKTVLKDAPSGRARDMLTLQLNEVGMHFAKRAIHFEASNRVLGDTQRTGGAMGDAVKAFMGGTKTFDETQQTIKDIAETAKGVVPDSALENIHNEAKRSLDISLINSLAPEKALFGLRMGDLGKSLDEDTKKWMMFNLERKGYAETSSQLDFATESLKNVFDQKVEGKDLSPSQQDALIKSYALANSRFWDFHNTAADLAIQNKDASPIDHALNQYNDGFDQYGSAEAPKGLLEKGNIDIRNRPIVKNADGTSSTVRSMSVNIDGKEILIPTVAADGSKILSDEEAIKQYEKTGKHLGVFDSPASATAYAEKLHEQQATSGVNQTNKVDKLGNSQVGKQVSKEGLQIIQGKLMRGEQLSEDETSAYKDAYASARVIGKKGDIQKKSYDQAYQEADYLLKQAQIISVTRSQMLGMKPEEMANFAQIIGDQFGEKSEVSKYVVKFAKDGIKAIQSDPASYVMQDSNIAQKISDADKAFAASTQTNLFQGEVASGARAKMESALSESYALQQKVGVSEPKPISNAQALTIAQTLSTSDASNVPKILDSLRQKYGKYYPDVISSVQGLKGSPLPAGYSMAASLDGSPYLSGFLTALQEEKKNPKAFTLGLDPKDNRSMHDALESDKVFQNFSKSAYAIDTRNAEFVNQTAASVMTYARYLRATEGIDSKIAVSTATKRLIGEQYTFSTFNDFTYAIPSKDEKGKAYGWGERSKIEESLAIYANGVGIWKDADLSKTIGRPIDEVGKASVIRQLQDKVFFATSSDSMGVNVFLNDGGKRVPVLDKSGNPIKMKFSDLLNSHQISGNDIWKASAISQGLTR